MFYFINLYKRAHECAGGGVREETDGFGDPESSELGIETGEKLEAKATIIIKKIIVKSHQK